MAAALGGMAGALGERCVGLGSAAAADAGTDVASSSGRLANIVSNALGGMAGALGGRCVELGSAAAVDAGADVASSSGRLANIGSNALGGMACALGGMAGALGGWCMGLGSAAISSLDLGDGESMNVGVRNPEVRSGSGLGCGPCAANASSLSRWNRHLQSSLD